MTDRPDEPHLTPAQAAEVRRLLADARHTEPIPVEVAERMDRVLTGLAAEPTRDATVVRLAARRRRAATMLVAAAAVVVAGVGIGQVVGGNGGGAGDAESGTAAEVEEAPDAMEAPPDAAGDAGGGARRDGLTTFQVRPGQFADDVARLQGQVARAFAADEAPQSEADPDRVEALRRAKGGVCEPGDWGRGLYQPVRYGGSPGYVVFREPRGDTRVADLFLCGSELVVRSVTLPSR